MRRSARIEDALVRSRPGHDMTAGACAPRVLLPPASQMAQAARRRMLSPSMGGECQGQ